MKTIYSFLGRTDFDAFSIPAGVRGPISHNQLNSLRQKLGLPAWSRDTFLQAAERDNRLMSDEDYERRSRAEVWGKSIDEKAAASVRHAEERRKVEEFYQGLGLQAPAGVEWPINPALKRALERLAWKAEKADEELDLLPLE